MHTIILYWYVLNIADVMFVNSHQNNKQQNEFPTNSSSYMVNYNVCTLYWSLWHIIYLS